MTKFSLERHRWFPYAAWTLIIMFTAFVFSLTLRLKATNDELAELTTRNELRANMNPQDITDFSR